MRSDDPTLLERAVAGDDEAVGQLLREHEPELRRRLTGEIPQRWQALLAADDIVQQTFTDVFVDIRRFRPSEARAFPAWLLTIARNNLREVLRSLETEKRGGLRIHVRLDRPDRSQSLLDLLYDPAASTPSYHAVRDELAAALAVALEKLSGIHRRVLELYDLEGRPVEEVAADIGRSQGAVYLLRNRAHRRLRELIAASGRFFSTSA